MVIVKNAGPRKYAMRRTEGIRWDRWHRKVVMRSLQMMVMSGVIRRAEVIHHAGVDLLQHRDDCADIESDTEASLSMPPVIFDEQGWFTRFVRRRADLLINHERHTT
jgi:hypothetical protein